MLGPISIASEELRSLITAAIEKAIEKGELAAPADGLPKFLIEQPADPTHGDFATNAAMAGARAFRKPPRAIAEAIIANLDLEGTHFDRAEVAGPGFINFFVSDLWFSEVVTRIIAEGENYGRTDYGKGQKVMVEFVSANPTGPMHMGNARGGAIGDGLAAALDGAGYNVTREFLVNDAGNQIEKFARSLEARYLQHFKGEEAVPFPEDGYHGADIIERAEQYIAEHGDDLLNAEETDRKKALVAFSLPKNIDKMKADLARYRIEFDNWFSETTLHESGAVMRAIDELTKRGYTYEKEGAVWYKNIEVQTAALLAQGKTQKQIDLLELKDDVLIRANGFPTYFAADIAYHANKFVDREYVKCINIWGADHHGHVARLKCALDALGVGGDKLDIVLMQLVRLTSNGELVRMSKRSGKAITLSNLLDDVPIDAARFFFNMREPGSQLDFDLDLAVEESKQNPVYYVQYAHARICSIIKNLAAEGVAAQQLTAEQLNILTHNDERELIRTLASFPEEIIAAAKNYDPARLTHFASEAATRFHKFYDSCHVKCGDDALMQARLTLCKAAEISIKNVLAMLKIDAPESM